MMKKILILESWQIFFLLFIPIVLSFILFPSAEQRLTSSVSHLLTLIFILLYIGWFFLLGCELYKKMDLMLTQKIKIKPFIYNFYFILIYVVVIYIVFKFSNYSYRANAILACVSSFAGLYVCFAIFYNIYFLAKSIVAIENHSTQNTQKLVFTFLLFCFLLVGIWSLQPRIKKILISQIE
jgi:hypothetical protein